MNEVQEERLTVNLNEICCTCQASMRTYLNVWRNWSPRCSWTSTPTPDRTRTSPASGNWWTGSQTCPSPPHTDHVFNYPTRLLSYLLPGPRVFKCVPVSLCRSCWIHLCLVYLNVCQSQLFCYWTRCKYQHIDLRLLSETMRTLHLFESFQWEKRIGYK